MWYAFLFLFKANLCFYNTLFEEMYDWQKASMTILKDDGMNADKQPTRDVIVRRRIMLYCHVIYTYI